MQLLAKVSRLVCVHNGVHSARASVTWASACTARAAACAAARAAIEGGARRGRVGERHRGRHAVALGKLGVGRVAISRHERFLDTVKPFRKLPLSLQCNFLAYF